MIFLQNTRTPHLPPRKSSKQKNISSPVGSPFFAHSSSCLFRSCHRPSYIRIRKVRHYILQKRIDRASVHQTTSSDYTYCLPQHETISGPGSANVNWCCLYFVFKLSILSVIFLRSGFNPSNYPDINYPISITINHHQLPSID